MECINDNFLSALNSTCYAANALVIINYSVIVYDFYSTFRTCSFTFTAGDTAETASLSYKIIVFFSGGARDKVCSVLRNHSDYVLRTYSCICTGTAAVALFFVDNDCAVFNLHCIELADFNAGAYTKASALTFASYKAHVLCF